MNDQQVRRSELRAAQLVPHAPPQVLQSVYSQEQLDTIFAVAHDAAPIPLLVRKAFRSVEEIYSATSGGNRGAKLEDFLAPMFAGDLANYSACLDTRMVDTFYNDKFIELVKGYWDAPIVLPRALRYHVAAPMKSSDPGHFDSPQFRGITYSNTPVWLIKLMGNSMLFDDYRIRLGSIVTWCWIGSEHGGFTYWPDGADGQPKRIKTPLWNGGCLAENEAMFHRGESIGSPGSWGLEGLTFDSVFEGDPSSKQHWIVRDGSNVIARYATADLRWMLHWTAMVFENPDELRTFADHTNDLTHDQIFATLEQDLKSAGIAMPSPSDPLKDPDLRQFLIEHYAIGSPKIYPEDAPVAPIAA